MLSRRGFLIGAGGLLTAAFVKDAQSFVLRNEQPLLVPPLANCPDLVLVRQ